MTIHFNSGLSPEDKKQLNRIENLLNAIIQQEAQTQMTLAELKVKVDAEIDLDKSAILLIQDIAQRLKDAATDPAAIQALADELDSEAVDLAAAIKANTPQA